MDVLNPNLSFVDAESKRSLRLKQEVHMEMMPVKPERKAQLETYAKEHGQSPAGMSRLGTMYEEGRGVRQEDGEAVAWYVKAAGAGDVRACYKLGVFYEKQGFRSQALAKPTGRIALYPASENQYYRRARMYYDAAANRYHYDAAKINLAYLYQNGLGVRRDLNAARILLAQAAMSGDEQVSASGTRLYIQYFGDSRTIRNYAQLSVSGTYGAPPPVDPLSALLRLNAMSHANSNENADYKSEQEKLAKARKNQWC